MAVELRLAPEVRGDLTEAYAWYESQRTGLGDRFLDTVDAGLDSVVKNPEAYARAFENCRRGFGRQFPYVIFFEQIEQIIWVYGILHSARNPDLWKERVG